MITEATLNKPCACRRRVEFRCVAGTPGDCWFYKPGHDHADCVYRFSAMCAHPAAQAAAEDEERLRAARAAEIEARGKMWRPS